MPIVENRRSFMTGVAAAGAAGFLGTAPALVGERRGSATEAALETTTVRLTSAPGICTAPQYVAESMIRAEGFTDFRFVDATAGLASTAMLAQGDVDFCIEFGTTFVISIDQGAPIKVLCGVHVGCYELFAQDDINGVLDLKGKSVGVGQNLGSDPHVFVSAMATNVGLDPVKDIHWVTSESNPIELFAQGKIDAFLSFPPEAQELRDRKIGHVVVNSITDNPWSQYYCCMLAGNAAYTEKNPAATKRVVRAILKGVEICVSNPDRVARLLVDGGYTDREDYAVQALTEIPYAGWREYDPEDTIRFFSLRLHEAGMVNATPHKIIADGTDWRILEELKRELKT